MLIKDVKKCEEFIAGDNSILKELLNPLKEDIAIRYSLMQRLNKVKLLLHTG